MNIPACFHVSMRVCADVAAPCRRSRAWDWAVSHKHVATDLYIPFSFLLHSSVYHTSSVFLPPLLCLFPPPRPSITSLSPLSPSPSHFPSIHSLSSITFSIPHSIFSACPLSFFPDLIIYFFFSHILRLMHTFQSFPKVLRTLYTLCTVSVLIQTQNVTVLQYNCALTCCAINQNLPPFSCIAFHSPSSGNVVWCL